MVTSTEPRPATSREEPRDLGFGDVSRLHAIDRVPLESPAAAPGRVRERFS